MFASCQIRRRRSWPRRLTPGKKGARQRTAPDRTSEEHYRERGLPRLIR